MVIHISIGCTHVYKHLLQIRETLVCTYYNLLIKVILNLEIIVLFYLDLFSNPQS